MTERRQRLALEVSTTGGGRFEILAITAGAANGWEFPGPLCAGYRRCAAQTGLG